MIPLVHILVLAEQIGLQRADAFALSTAENDDSGRVKLVQRQRGEQLVDVQLHDDFAKRLHGVEVNKMYSVRAELQSSCVWYICRTRHEVFK